MQAERKVIWGWALYDWANSAFATTVMAGFFPLFFKQYWSAGANINQSTAALGWANSLASLLVALAAPLMGAIADRRAGRKGFLILFTYLGVLATAGLFWVARGEWLWAAVLYVMGVIGFSGANIFYDSLLPQVTGDQSLERVSGLGFAMGYLGGGLLFLGNVLMVQRPAWFGLAGAAAGVRWSFISVALWWALFSLATFYWVPAGARQGRPGPLEAVRQGLAQLGGTLRRLRRFRDLGLFLVAYWFYIDGVDTVVRMAVDYGLSLGFASGDLIAALLLTQFVGFPAALAFARLGQAWGPRRAIYLALAVYMLVTIWGMLIRRPVEFYFLAGVIGLVQGGIQALSRSYYARLIPAGQEAEFFGFYNMLGKFAAIGGPALMGTVGLLMRRLLLAPGAGAAETLAAGRLAARLSIGSILILFLIGGLLFHFVDGRRGRAAAAEWQDGNQGRG